MNQHQNPTSTRSVQSSAGGPLNAARIMTVSSEVLMRQLFLVLSVLLLLAFQSAAQQPSGTQTEAQAAPRFLRSEVMIPMQDGTHLQTAIFRPLEQHEPLPILLQRTPYGVPEDEK